MYVVMLLPIINTFNTLLICQLVFLSSFELEIICRINSYTRDSVNFFDLKTNYINFLYNPLIEKGKDQLHHVKPHY